MKIVLDANLVASLFIRLPYSDSFEQLMRVWRREVTEFYAPALFPAELVSVIRKMEYAKQISAQDAQLALLNCARLPIQVVIPDESLLQMSLKWAETLGQKVAYDAQYLSLAERLSADFWTADQRLFRSLIQSNRSWVHWVGEIA